MNTAIHWFRCDLRLSDNTALHRACLESKHVVPVFIFDPAILLSKGTGPNQVAFMLDCLHSLAKNIEARGGRLIFRHGNPLDEMARLISETKAEAVFWNSDQEPYSRKRDQSVVSLCEAKNVRACPCEDSMILPPASVLKQDATPFVIFTPYSKVWRQIPKPSSLPPPKQIRPTEKLTSLPLPTAKDLGFHLKINLPAGGEKAARDCFEKFRTRHLREYRTTRDIPFLDTTSHLSPHIRMGTISARTLYHKATEDMKKHPGSQTEIDTFINELIWRDFYHTILWHFPHVENGAFKENLRNIPWQNSKEWFQRWCEGKTGYPIVDAAMRQLNQTGWMHNRLRMVVSSFLTKDLLVNWQWGEAYFMQHLIDADLAANNGGWQWSAGTGTDAQPYFRIFNPASQAEKFDPEGRFIQQYVPEVLSLKYPPPIIDHSLQRVKALKLYKQGN